MKNLLKEKAIKLRVDGLSYSEIRKQIKVSKSSLSLWLRSVGLTKRQKQRLTEKKWAAIKRGWEKWKNQRKEKTRIVNKEAIKQINVIKKTNEKLFLMGIMLYWAEGAKEKEYKLGQGISFSNSDYKIIKLFLEWLKKCLKLPEDRIVFDIYIHENNKYRLKEVKLFWSKITGYSINKFGKIYFKKHKIKTLRHNVKNSYNGLLRVKVTKSTYLNRRITGWIEGICKKWEIVQR